MTHSRHLLVWLVAVGLMLVACSPQNTPSTAPKRSPTVEIVAAEAKGFTVGAMMNANAVYVFFDAQCPHCAHLWQASVPLHKKARFIWIPIGMINPSSTSQGAALLSATDPGQTMAEHEASMLAGKGGMSVPSGVSQAMTEAIQSNTRLFNNLGVESVPFIVARNPRTGQAITRNGSMSTQALAELIGVDMP